MFVEIWSIYGNSIIIDGHVREGGGVSGCERGRIEGIGADEATKREKTVEAEEDEKSRDD